MEEEERLLRGGRKIVRELAEADATVVAKQSREDNPYYQPFPFDQNESLQRRARNQRESRAKQKETLIELQNKIQVKKLNKSDTSQT